MMHTRLHALLDGLGQVEHTSPFDVPIISVHNGSLI